VIAADTHEPKKDRQGGHQFADEIDLQQRIDELWVVVIDPGNPSRTSLAQIAITRRRNGGNRDRIHFRSFVFDAIVEREIAAAESAHELAERSSGDDRRASPKTSLPQ
jgi:hypothetical protein